MEHPEHGLCADECGLDVDHTGACRVYPGGREVCEHGDQCAEGHSDLAQCGTCERVWCDTCTPTPAARCPFEYGHDEADDNPLNDYDSDDAAELGRLLDARDVASGGDSTDVELDALRDALDQAVAMLEARGVEIPRGGRA